MELKGAEIFQSGEWNARTFTEADLDGIVSSFEALGLSGRIPLKFGHNGTDARDGAPALGWVSRVWREGQKLLADFTGIPRVVYDAIKAGLYKFVSVELLRDVQAGTRLIPWTLDAAALLGATPPAVGTLRDLQSLTMARRPALRFAERLTFSREDTPQAQIAALQRQLLTQAQDFDVRAGRVLPAERTRFDRRHRDDPRGATAEAWQAWVADAPRPASFKRGGAMVALDHDDDEPPTFAEPDAQVVHLTRKEIEKSGGKLSFREAQLIVLRRDPALAEAYRSFPGERR